MKRIKQKIRPSTLDTESGFTLVEVIIALVLFAIVMVSMAKLYAVGVTHTVNQGDRRIATSLGEEFLEQTATLQFSTIQSTYLEDPPGSPIFTTVINSTVSGNENALDIYNRTDMFDYVDEDDYTSVAGAITNAIRTIVIISPTTANTGFQGIAITTVNTNWQ